MMETSPVRGGLQNSSRIWSLREELFVDVCHLISDVRHHAAWPYLGAKPHQQRTISHKPFHGQGRRSYIVIRHQQSISFVSNQLRYSSQVRADHRYSSGKGFEHDERTGFQPLGRNRKYIYTTKEISDAFRFHLW